jgi:CBS domain-containing protein
MPIGNIRTREVVVARRDMTVSEAARLMRNHHVGDVVVVDELDGRKVPCGILTDRDIVIGLVAEGLDADTITVSDLMTTEIIVARELDGVADTLEVMRVKAVRRMPIVDALGTLVGIVTADDLLQLLSEEMSALAAMINREQRREVSVRK